MVHGHHSLENLVSSEGTQIQAAGRTLRHILSVISSCCTFCSNSIAPPGMRNQDISEYKAQFDTINETIKCFFPINKDCFKNKRAPISETKNQNVQTTGLQPVPPEPVAAPSSFHFGSLTLKKNLVNKMFGHVAHIKVLSSLFRFLS